MAAVIEVNKPYPIEAGCNQVLLTDHTSITIQAKGKGSSNWKTLVSAGGAGSYTIPFLSNAEFRVSAQSGGNETELFVSPYQG